MKKNAKAIIRISDTEWKSLIFQNKIFDDLETFKFTKDSLSKIHMGVSFEKDFIHFPLFRDEFTKLFESDILKKYGLSDYSKEELKEFEIVSQEIERKVLSLEGLKSEFVIWLVTVFFSIIVFICEIMYFHISKKRKGKKTRKKSKI